MDQPPLSSKSAEETALLIGIHGPKEPLWQVEDYLEELDQLSSTAGARVAVRKIIRLAQPNPACYIGSGKADEVAILVKEAGASLVVFDEDLTPVQGRNLEKRIGTRVIDRTQLILDIFAQHAHTKEGCLQIELAQLEYLLPRLRRLWTHLERQKGGIGLRGPGEQQLEVDRRRIQERIVRLKHDLEDVRRHRGELRRGRRRHGWALISIVGYTNAGKSTLLNALTGADVKAYDQLFATLDPTTRKVELPNHQPALLTDTVGFIRKLPHHLVESFKATLEEVAEADLLMHVIDASHPHVEEQVKAVDQALRDLRADTKAMLIVFNKMDMECARSQARRIAAGMDSALGSVEVSARTGEGLEQLRHKLADALKDQCLTVTLSIPLTQSRLIASLRKVGHIYEEEYGACNVTVKAYIPKRFYGAYTAYTVDDPGQEDEA